jgi:putative Mg2+ transporter-C (MgtC) family protein
MPEWWEKTAADFSDLPDIGEAVRLTVRLLFAAILGGMLGYDRERAGKSAGLRTHMLVALGAALFVMIPQQADLGASEISRVIQGIVAGVGFLGAGAIVKDVRGSEVRGLTTAAGIWLTAAVGVAAGLGREASAVLGTVLALIILSGVVRISRWIDKRSAKDAKATGLPSSESLSNAALPDSDVGPN